jgi:CBS domain containing-hemolysin-like protein
VTLEDLLEEIVGEVSDPFDTVNPEIQTLPDGSILIDGLTLIEEVNQQLSLNLQDPNYDTIAGYALGKLGRIPRQGDSVEGEGVRLRVESMDGLRIAQLSLRRLPAEATSD